MDFSIVPLGEAPLNTSPSQGPSADDAETAAFEAHLGKVDRRERPARSKASEEEHRSEIPPDAPASPAQAVAFALLQPLAAQVLLAPRLGAGLATPGQPHASQAALAPNSGGAQMDGAVQAPFALTAPLISNATSQGHTPTPNSAQPAMAAGSATPRGNSLATASIDAQSKAQQVAMSAQMVGPDNLATPTTQMSSAHIAIAGEAALAKTTVSTDGATPSEPIAAILGARAQGAAAAQPPPPPQATVTPQDGQPATKHAAVANSASTIGTSLEAQTATNKPITPSDLATESAGSIGPAPTAATEQAVAEGNPNGPAGQMTSANATADTSNKAQPTRKPTPRVNAAAEAATPAQPSGAASITTLRGTPTLNAGAVLEFALATPPLDSASGSVSSTTSTVTTLATTTHRAGETALSSGTAGPRPAPHVQLAQQIVRRFESGGAQFEMRMDPPELGRVDVKLEVGRDRRVTAVVTAEHASTLTELARGSRDLERILEAAGLELDQQGLSFNLASDRGGDSEKNMAQGDRLESDTAEATTTSAPSTASGPRPFGLEAWRVGRVDMTA